MSRDPIRITIEPMEGTRDACSVLLEVFREEGEQKTKKWWSIVSSEFKLGNNIERLKHWVAAEVENYMRERI